MLYNGMPPSLAYSPGIIFKAILVVALVAIFSHSIYRLSDVYHWQSDTLTKSVERSFRFAFSPLSDNLFKDLRLYWQVALCPASTITGAGDSPSGTSSSSPIPPDGAAESAELHSLAFCSHLITYLCSYYHHLYRRRRHPQHSCYEF